MDAARAAAVRRGLDIIPLGVGDPDLPTPPLVREALKRAADRPEHHRYPPYAGLAALREAAARYLGRTFGVHCDPEREILVLIGSKEGIGHLPLALLDPGDAALVPDPGYPVYAAGARFAGAEAVPFALDPRRGHLPDLAALEASAPPAARLLWLNYPHNPTAAVADRAFLGAAAALCQRRGMVLAYDFSYAEIFYDAAARPPSLLASAGDRAGLIEFHSLSKTFNMTGWRVGFAAGDAEVIAALLALKTNLDSGAFGAIQEAAAAALDRAEECAGPIRAEYRRRRDALLPALRRAGVEAAAPAATFYVWAPVPGGGPSQPFCARLLEEAGVATAPGVGFGAAGEGWFRLSLTAPLARIEEAAERLQRVRWW
jgi:LL-diaminopimelate aminotransferase